MAEQLQQLMNGAPVGALDGTPEWKSQQPRYIVTGVQEYGFRLVFGGVQVRAPWMVLRNVPVIIVATGAEGRSLVQMVEDPHLWAWVDRVRLVPINA